MDDDEEEVVEESDFGSTDTDENENPSEENNNDDIRILENVWSAAEWRSKKFAQIFKQMKIDGKLVDKIECKICKKQFKSKSRNSIRKHFYFHEHTEADLDKEIVAAALNVVCLDGCPFTFIEKDGFKQLANVLLETGKNRPYYTKDNLPSERTLRRAMLDKREEMLQSDQFKQFVANLKFGGSLSYDFGIHSGQNFLTIFGHTLTENYELETAMLSFKEYDAGKSREEIRDELEAELDQIGISDIEMSLLFHITDGAANIAVQNTELHVVCIVHVLNRVIFHTTKPYRNTNLRHSQTVNVNKMNRLLRDLRQFVSQMKNSDDGRKCHLVAPTQVRFATNVKMVRSFVDHANECQALLLQPGLEIADDFDALHGQMDKFQDFLDVTEPIDHFLQEFEERNGPTAHRILTGLGILEIILDDIYQDDSRSEFCQDLAYAALDALDRNLSAVRGGKVNKRFLYAAALLSPGNYCIFDKIFEKAPRWNQEEAIQSLKHMLAQLQILDQYRTVPQPAHQQQALEPGPYKRSRFKRRRVAEEDDGEAEIVALQAIGNNINPDPDLYDVLAFWRSHSQEFPKLSKLARQLLCVPAGNIECERAFSIHRWMKNERRLSLSDKQNEALLMNRNVLGDVTNTR